MFVHHHTKLGSVLKHVGHLLLELYGFHIVVSVVSVVRKKFIGQLQLYGNLPCKCSIQKKRQIQLFVRDRMNSLCPMNFFRMTDTTDTTDTTIWKPGFNHSTESSLRWMQCTCTRIIELIKCTQTVRVLI